MFKKLFVIFGAVFAVIIIVLTMAVVFIYTKVDKAFISAQLANVLNRQVYIEKIKVGIFSVVSGVEIKNLTISNFKAPEYLQKFQGNPVAPAEAFFSAETLLFKVKILPLLKRQLELKELVLFRPVLNIYQDRQGVLNIDDLIKSGKRPENEKKTEPLPRSKPISVDDLLASVSVGEIGAKHGTINYSDDRFDQKMQVYELTAIAHDINIDPLDLEKKNVMKLKVEMGFKTVGPMKTGSVQNFDLLIKASGKAIPFDVQTRQLDPEMALHIAIPEGEITGLQVFNYIAAVPVLVEYLSEHISFLKGKQQWKNSSQTGLYLRYKSGRAKLDNGKLDIREAELLFDGTLNFESKELAMNLNMVMKKEINEAVKTSLARKMEMFIKSPDLKKYADTGKLAQTAMAPLLDKDGRINLKARVGGTTKKPDVRVIEPKLISLESVAKDMAGNLAIEAGKGAAKKIFKDDKQKIIHEVEGLFKRK